MKGPTRNLTLVLCGFFAFLGLTAILIFPSWITLAWTLVAMVSVVAIGQKISINRFKNWSKRPLSEPEKVPPNLHSVAKDFAATLQDSRSTERGYIDALRLVRNTADKLPDACVIISGEGVIEEVNKAANTLLGLSRRDEGKIFTSLIRDQGLHDALTEGRFDQPQELRSPVDGLLQLEIRLIPLEADRLLLVARDVTQLKKLLAMRQDFIANVSHELRTPLTTLLGYTESLVEEDLDEDTSRQLAQRLKEPTERMKSLVEDLMVLTELESTDSPAKAKVSCFDGRSMIEAMMVEVKDLSAGKHCFQSDLEDGLYTQGVYGEIHSAVFNLISNAIRYSPSGGNISIKWRAVDSAHIRFSVSDQGIGIPSEHLNRITERFYRVPHSDRSAAALA